MKITIISLFATLFASFSYGAQLAWSVESWIPTATTTTNGTAYLIQATSAVDITTIDAHLSKYGVQSTAAQKANFMVLNSGGSSVADNYDSDEQILSVSTKNDNWTSANDLTSIFVLVLTGDGSYYLDTNIGNAVANTMLGADYLYTTSLAGVKALGAEQLPEPGVLALLTLGVAGFVLRRKQNV